MKLSILISTFLFFFTQSNQDAVYTYVSENGNVELVFDLALGAMNAQTDKAQSGLDIKSDEVDFVIKVNSFRFSNPILEQQFKHVYMESDKYPETVFNGQIKGGINFKSTAPQNVKVNGVLDMHGVKKAKIIPAVITVKNDQIHVVTDFVIKASEHNIDIPTSFFNNGKDEIKVNMNVTYKKK